MKELTQQELSCVNGGYSAIEVVIGSTCLGAVVGGLGGGVIGVWGAANIGTMLIDGAFTACFGFARGLAAGFIASSVYVAGRALMAEE